MRLPTLKKRSEFQRVKDGSKWAAKSFVLQAKVRGAGEMEGPARFGFTVSGRTLAEREGDRPVKRGNAVKRNRAKRRLKEAVRLLAPSHARADHDYVIIARREALHQSFANLLEDLASAFAKVHRSACNKDNDGRSGKKRAPRTADRVPEAGKPSSEC